jgi:hypothetical protein
MGPSPTEGVVSGGFVPDAMHSTDREAQIEAWNSRARSYGSANTRPCSNLWIRSFMTPLFAIPIRVYNSRTVLCNEESFRSPVWCGL